MRKLGSLLIPVFFAVGSVQGCGGDSSGSDAGTDATTPDGSHEGGKRDSGKPIEGGPSEGGCGKGEASCMGTCVNMQTDKKNCGGCGLTCSSSCVGGECVETVATFGSGAGPWALAIDSTSIYWTSLGSCTGGDGGTNSGAVLKMALDGSMQMTLASGQGQPSAIAVDDKNVYWVNEKDCAGQGQVMKATLSGGSAVTLAGGLDAPSTLAVDAKNVYFTTNGDVMSVPIDGLPDGGAPAVLASGQGTSAGIGVEGSTVYFGGGKPPNIKNVSTTGGKVTNMTPKTACDMTYCDRVNGLTTDSMRVFWSAVGTGSYDTASVSGMHLSGGMIQELDTNQGTVANLASDGTNLYWTTYSTIGSAGGDSNTVEKVAVSGGTPVTIAKGQAGPRGIALDSKSVYWANSGTPHAIMKATPK